MSHRNFLIFTSVGFSLISICLSSTRFNIVGLGFGIFALVLIIKAIGGKK